MLYDLAGNQGDIANFRKEMSNIELSIKETIHSSIQSFIKQSEDEMKKFIVDTFTNHYMQDAPKNITDDQSTCFNDYKIASDNKHAPTMQKNNRSHFKRSFTEKSFSLEQDNSAEIYKYLKANQYNSGLTNCVDAKSTAFQQKICLNSTQNIQVTGEDLKANFDKNSFIRMMKQELKHIKKDNTLEYCKLSKELNTFHRFPPKDAFYVILSIIITAPKVADKLIIIPSVLRVLIFDAVGGIDPDNPKHFAAVMNCIHSVDESMHVSQFLNLIASADVLLTNFCKNYLGWNNNQALNKCGDIKSLYACLSSLSYVHLHPAFNIQFNDTENDGKFLFSDSIDNLRAHLNAECFMKYSIPNGPSKIEGTYQDLRSNNIFNETIVEMKRNLASVDVNLDPVLEELTTQYNHLAKIVSILFEQRDYLALTNITWLIKDFARDPKFRKESLNVIKKFSLLLEKEHQFLPLEQLKDIIEKELKTNEFNPSVDASLMRQTLVEKMLSFNLQSNIYFNQNPLNFQLNKEINANFLCHHCQSYHADTFECIPEDGDYVAWNNFAITRAFLNDRIDSRNTDAVLQQVFKKIFASQYEASNHTQAKKRSKTKKQIQKYKKKK
ncbi:hypothetical protein QEN19_000419 [Hanseniaspora menglaensis]